MPATSIDDLLTRLRDEDATERRLAALSLARSDDQLASSGLIEALNDANREVRLLAAEALGLMTIPDAVPALSAALQDEWDQVRRFAARSLEKVGNASALSALSEALDDTDQTTAAHAALALGKIGRSEAIPALLATLRKTAHPELHTNLYRACAFALSQIAEVIANDTEAVAKTVLVPALLETLGDEHYGVRVIAAKLLGQLGNARGVDFLIAALDDEDWQRRAAVAGALGEGGSERAVEPLIALLRDEYASVRRAAASSLGELGDARAVQSLLDALGAVEQPTVQFPHGSLLGKINDPRDTRYAIALALERLLGEAGAEEALTAVLNGEADSVDLLHKARSWLSRSFRKAGFTFGGKAAGGARQPEQNMPRTIEEAVHRLVEELPLQVMLEIAQKPTELKVIANYHFGLGTGIRNNFGLFAGNNPSLAEACGPGGSNPDHASSVILAELWKKLREAPVEM
jgi:HEAT repeat protein